MLLETSAAFIICGGAAVFALCRAVVAESATEIKEAAKQNAKEAIALRFASAIRVARPGEVIGDKPLLKLVKGPKEIPVTDAKGTQPKEIGDAHKSANAVLDALARLAEQAEEIGGARAVLVFPPSYASKKAYSRTKKA